MNFGVYGKREKKESSSFGRNEMEFFFFFFCFFLSPSLKESISPLWPVVMAERVYASLLKDQLYITIMDIIVFKVSLRWVYIVYREKKKNIHQNNNVHIILWLR